MTVMVVQIFFRVKHLLAAFATPMTLVEVRVEVVIIIKVLVAESTITVNPAVDKM